MIIDMIMVTMGCWMLLGLLTYGRKKVLNMIPLFRDNDFDEDEFDPGNLMYDILKMRRETTEDFSYKKMTIFALISMIPVVNFFIGIFLTAWIAVLILTDLGLAARYGLQKFDFWDRKI